MAMGPCTTAKYKPQVKQFLKFCCTITTNVMQKKHLFSFGIKIEESEY